MKRTHRIASGFTLIELTIVIGLVGAVTMALIAGYKNQSQVEYFSGRIRQIADELNQSQLAAYSVSSDTACNAALSANCFMRGVLHEYSVTDNSFKKYDLYGADVLRIREEGDGYGGLYSKNERASESILFSSQGIELTEIAYGSSSSSPGTASIAFYTPQGTALARPSIYAFSGASGVSPYTDRERIELTFEDQATELVGTVIFDTRNGTIDTSVK